MSTPQDIFIIEDDTYDEVKNAATHAALALKGNIWWGNGLYHLTQMLKQVTPRFLILDNNLGDGKGIEWITDAISRGKISTETIIASISSSDRSLVARMARNLDALGIGAFYKERLPEMLLWMSRRDIDLRKGRELTSQFPLFDPGEGSSEHTDFWRNTEGLILSDPRLEKIARYSWQNLYGEWPPDNRSGTIIIPEQDTVGLFPGLLEKYGMSEIIEMKEGQLRDEFSQLYEGAMALKR